MQSPATIHRAHAKRPKDERYADIGSLLKRANHDRTHSKRVSLDLAQTRVTANNHGTLCLNGTKHQAALTDFSFQQFCKLVNVPSSFLGAINPEIAAAAINDVLPQYTGTPRSVLLRGRKNLHIAGINSLHYSTIWNADMLNMIAQAQDDGWTLAHKNAAYYSDHNVFAFFVRDDITINDGSRDGLKRGFMICNSECGDMALTMRQFLFRSVCENLCIFGLKNVEEMRINHIGDADKRAYGRIQAELHLYATHSAKPVEAIIKKAQKTEIAKNKDDTARLLHSRDITTLTDAAAAWDEAEQHSDIDGAPSTVWGMFQGLTRISQRYEHGDKRVSLDRSAGRILHLAA